MADIKISGLASSAGVVAGDLFVVVDDPGGTPATQQATGTQVAAMVAATYGVAKGNATASDPTTGDDDGDGYEIGSLWVNTSDGGLWLCTDASTAAAVWVELATVDGTAPAESPIRVVSTSTTITSADADGIVIMTPLTSSDLTATLDSSLPLGFRVAIVRGAVGTANGSVLLADNSGGTIAFSPRDQLTRDNEMANMVLAIKSGSDRTWAAQTPDLRPRVITVTADTTLTDAHDGMTVLADTATAGATIALTISDSISVDWQCTVIREGATDSVTIAGQSTQTCVGPAASAGTVTISVDYGGVALVRLASDATWAAGSIS